MSLIKMKTAMNNQGLFEHFTDVPWITEIASEPLDLVYSTRSSDKWVAPMISSRLDDIKIHLSSDDLDTIAIAIQTIFGVNWNKLWEAIHEEYKTTENYDIKNDIQETGKIVDAEESDGSVNNSSSSQGDSADKVFGYNSTVGVDSDSTASTNSDTSEEIRHNERGNQRDTDIHTVMHKHGNIGVMIYPSMLKAEIDVRKWNFFEQVFSDIDSILTLSVY